MSEAGSSARQRQSQVSRRSRQEQPLPSADQQNLNWLKNQYQPYQEPSTASQDAPFRIYQQEVLPLIKALNEQNSKLKSERQTIAQEFKKMDYVTEVLQKENELLRKHCDGRSKDLLRLIETISLNYHQEQNDLNHRIHLLKQENNHIIRRLNVIMKEQGQIEDEIEKQEAVKVSLENGSRQELMRKMQCQAHNEQMQSQIGEMDSNINQLLAQFEQTNENLNKLLIDNMKLKETNLEKIYELKDFELQINRKKPQIQKDNVRLHSDILALKRQVHGAQQQLQEKKRKVKRMEEQCEKQRQQVREKQLFVDQNNLKLTQNLEQHQKNDYLINESRQRQAMLNQQCIDKAKRLEELKKQLKNTEIENQQKSSIFAQQLRQKKSKGAAILRTLQSTYGKRVSAYNQESNSLEYTIKQLKNSIEAAKSEIKDYDSDLSDVNRQLEGFSQTKKEIQRVNYQLKQIDQELAMSRRTGH